LAIFLAQLPISSGQAAHPHGLSFAFFNNRSFVCFSRRFPSAVSARAV
jgi:hypothetical protein